MPLLGSRFRFHSDPTPQPEPARHLPAEPTDVRGPTHTRARRLSHVSRRDTYPSARNLTMSGHPAVRAGPADPAPGPGGWFSSRAMIGQAGAKILGRKVACRQTPALVRLRRPKPLNVKSRVHFEPALARPLPPGEDVS